MQAINPVIRILITSDFFVLSGIGFFNPVLAIFVTQQVQGGDAQVAGFAWAIYFAMWIVQIPIGKYLDRNHGDIDDFWFLLTGAFFTAAVPFLYLFASLPWHVYLLQALLGLGRGISLPPWYALFTRRIDKAHEGYEWGMENVVAGMGLALAGALAGIIVKRYGFEAAFIFAGFLSLIGSSALIFLRRHAYQKDFFPAP